MTNLSGIQDVIVVGAGPAGLTAAIYLGRFRRPCIVLEDGQSRARWIPTSHNIPGFASGIGGQQLLQTLRLQAAQYGAQFRQAAVSQLRRREGVFELRIDDELLRSRYVLLATGVRDHLPAIAGASEAILRSIVRFCPICDAYEAIDKRIAIIGNGAVGEREAQFLRHYSDRVTLLQIGEIHAPEADRPPADGIERISSALDDLHLANDRVLLRTVRGNREFDVMYVALGCSAQHALASDLSAEVDERGALRVNAHQETSVPGLYAAGDVVRGLNQVVVAAAESAIAATDIHNKLRAV